MASYAIIKAGGKQVKVVVGEYIWVEKIKDSKEGSKHIFKEVLAYFDGKKLLYGKPLLKQVSVKATVEKNGKGKKLVIFRTKQKSNWARKQGHRQPYTMLKVDSIDVAK